MRAASGTKRKGRGPSKEAASHTDRRPRVGKKEEQQWEGVGDSIFPADRGGKAKAKKRGGDERLRTHVHEENPKREEYSKKAGHLSQSRDTCQRILK